MNPTWIIKTVVFLSAFLLFQIELIIGKIFLPRYGGSFMVWGACMVFFQALLLLGYLYAHVVIQKIRLERYRYWHLALLALPFFFFPGRSISIPQAGLQLPMVFEVFLELTFILGPVFFVLSTMSIIYQAWLSKSDLPDASNPYALFAVSNLGSFTALLTYPFFFEMYLDLDIQQNIWRAGYVLIVLLHFSAVKMIRFSGAAEKSDHSGMTPVPQAQQWRWLLFGAAGVMMFLAVTNVITLTITPMPLLWVLPLAVYLLSYVLNFKKEPFSPAWIGEKFDVTVAYGIFVYFLLVARILPVLWELVLLLAFLFVVCMYCQRELYRDRPKDDRQLSYFYFLTALGGFLGGFFVTWIVPLVSASLVEYFMGPLAIYAARLLGEKDWKIDRYFARFIFYWLAAMALWPTVFPKLSLLGIVLMIIILTLVFRVLKRNLAAMTAGLLIIIFSLALLEPSWMKDPSIYKLRNYYGILRVVERQGLRMLIHGKTIHGTQYFENDRINTLLYYPNSPIERLLASGAVNFESIGVVGLGVGILGMYNNPGHEMDFYELDPDVLTVAEKYFGFLKRSPGKVTHYIGDGRIALSQSRNGKYDIIVLDAFNGDSIPTHFLTKEAFGLYKEKIKGGGIVLFHISNQLFDPLKVLYATAAAAGARGCFLDGRIEFNDVFNSKWFAVTWDPQTFEVLTTRLKWHVMDPQSFAHVRIWTDQYSNVLPYMNLFKGPPVAEKN